MSNNDQLPQEKPPLGESSSHFGWTTTGELEDATDLPPADEIAGVTAVKFTIVSVDNRPGLLVNTVFIPPSVELTLPTRVGLATAYDRFGKPAKAYPEDSAEFRFAKLARWGSAMRMNDRGINAFGGFLNCLDGRTGLFFAKFLANNLQYDVAKRDPEDYNNLKRTSQPRYEDDPISQASALMRLIIGCGHPDEQSFKTELVLHRQEMEMAKPTVKSVGQSVVAAA